MCEWRLGWIKQNYTLEDEVGNCEGIHIPSSYVFGFDCCILGHLLAYREDLDCLWIVHIYHRFFLGTGRLEGDHIRKFRGRGAFFGQQRF